MTRLNPSTTLTILLCVLLAGTVILAVLSFTDALFMAPLLVFLSLDIIVYVGLSIVSAIQDVPAKIREEADKQ